MVAYADTSFFFSLFAQDANTVQAGQIAATLQSPLVITPLQRHELRNAFRLSLFRRDITATECQRLLDAVGADIKTGVLVDPTGESFCFEKGAAKHEGGDGFADVWKRGFFCIEYKGKHKDLGAAYT